MGLAWIEPAGADGRDRGDGAGGRGVGCVGAARGLGLEVSETRFGILGKMTAFFPSSLCRQSSIKRRIGRCL